MVLFPVKVIYFKLFSEFRLSKTRFDARFETAPIKFQENVIDSYLVDSSRQINVWFARGAT